MVEHLILDTNRELFDMGTKPVITSIEQCLAPTGEGFDIVLINILTICRNVCSSYSVDLRKEIIEKGNIQAVVDHVTTVLIYLVDIIRSNYKNTQSCVPRHVIAYMFDYGKIIPSDYYRIPTDHFTHSVEEELKKKTERGCIKIDDIVLEAYPETTRPSYIELNDIIQPIQNCHNVLMVSHHPIDYHLALLVNKFKLVSSFTGDIKIYDEVSKTVFGSPDIPFTPTTHVLFGDKVDMKQTLKRGQRNKLIELAQKELWNLFTKDQLDSRLLELQINSPYYI